MRILFFAALFGIFALPLLAARPAEAGTLFVGSEDIDFDCLGTTASCTSAASYGYYNNYGRKGYGANAVGSTSDPPASYMQSLLFTSAASIFWFHGTLDQQTGNNTLNSQGVRLLSPDGVARLVLRGTGTSNKFKISKRDSAGTFTDLVTMATGATTDKNFVDLYVNYAVAGQVTLYINGVPVADYTGDVTTNGATTLQQLQIGSFATTSSLWFSEIIVSTTDTRNMRVVTLDGAANGNTANWTNGGVANVNEVVLSDTSINSSGTAGQIQLYTLNDLPASTAFSVVDVWEVIRTQVDTTGPQHIRAMLRTNSANYTSGNLSPPQLTWGAVRYNWPTNPNTSAAWTMTEINALEAGFDSQN